MRFMYNKTQTQKSKNAQLEKWKCLQPTTLRYLGNKTEILIVINSSQT